MFISERQRRTESMKAKKTLCLLLAAAVSAAALAGCGGVNPTETVATVNGRAIEAGLVNFVAQNTAASYDTYMASYYGADMWEQEMGSTEGETLADEVRKEAVEEVEFQYLLEEHMGDYGVTITDEDMQKVDSAVSEFLSENTDKALKIMGASEKYVREMLRLELLEQKMQDAIYATADTNVTDEELAERNAEAEEANASADSGDEETESETPKMTKEDIVKERQADLYNEITQGYRDSADFVINENVLKKISFKNFLNIVSDEEPETTESVAETEVAESVVETEAAGTEAGE